MHRREVKEEQKEELGEYGFRAGSYTFVFTVDGVLCAADGEREELFSYEEVKLYRAYERSYAKREGKEKLYFTVPVSAPDCYNRFCFVEGGKTYLSHEIPQEDWARLESEAQKYSVSVIDKRIKPSGIVTPLKTFREDSGVAHKLVVSGASILLALLLGALIMYLINYFLHTDTESLTVVFGIFCLPCLFVVLIKSQELGSRVKICNVGAYLKIRSKSGYGGTNSPFAIDNVFFCWKEVDRIERVQLQVNYSVRFYMGYCVYSVPDFNGLYEFLLRRFPEKCTGGEA